MDRRYAEAWWNNKLPHGVGIQAKHRAVAELVEESSFPLVDLGAGNGCFLRLLEERYPGADISGIEFSQGAAASKVCKAPIVHADISTWSPSGGGPNTLTLIDVIEHQPDPMPLLRHLHGAAPRLIIACPNFSYLTARVDVFRGRIPFQNRPARGGHVYWCQYRALHALFLQAGYRVVRENHLYPKHKWTRKFLSAMPALFAHEFIFLLQAA